MIAQVVWNERRRSSGRASPTKLGAKTAQRAVLAAHCVAWHQRGVRPLADAFHVSRRSLRRGQLLLESGNRELLADVLLGRCSLTAAATALLEARGASVPEEVAS